MLKIEQRENKIENKIGKGEKMKRN